MSTNGLHALVELSIFFLSSEVYGDRLLDDLPVALQQSLRFLMRQVGSNFVYCTTRGDV